MVLPRRFAAWGVLGVPRLHYTLSTGEIATKEAAARYSLEVFEPSWRPLIEDAMRWWRGEAAADPYRGHPRRRLYAAVQFVECVIDAGNRLPAPED